MARIRTIKPEFWSSPSVAGADPWVRLLYIAMWNWADDYGRGTANVKELAAFAFPHDEDPGAPTSTELPCMLAEIAGRFSVVFYEADGRRYYAIPSWDTHQRNERRAQSRYPAPDDGKPYNPDPSDQRKPTMWRKPTETSDAPHGNSVQEDGSSATGTGEQGNRGTSSSSDSAPPKSDDDEKKPKDEPQRDDVDALCSRLRDWMIHNEVKPPTIGKRWKQQARLLLDQDKRELSKALNLIDWCQQHHFWKSNIHSLPTFREQYDKLAIQAREEWRHRGQPQIDTDVDKNPWAGIRWV